MQNGFYEHIEANDSLQLQNKGSYHRKQSRGRTTQKPEIDHRKSGI